MVVFVCNESSDTCTGLCLQLPVWTWSCSFWKHIFRPAARWRKLLYSTVLLTFVQTSQIHQRFTSLHSGTLPRDFMIKARFCLPNSQGPKKIDCSYAYSAQGGGTEIFKPGSLASIVVDFLKEYLVFNPPTTFAGGTFSEMSSRY